MTSTTITTSARYAIIDPEGRLMARDGSFDHEGDFATFDNYDVAYHEAPIDCEIIDTDEIDDYKAQASARNRDRDPIIDEWAEMLSVAEADIMAEQFNAIAAA